MSFRDYIGQMLSENIHLELTEADLLKEDLEVLEEEYKQHDYNEAVHNKLKHKVLKNALDKKFNTNSDHRAAMRVLRKPDDFNYHTIDTKHGPITKITNKLTNKVHMHI